MIFRKSKSNHLRSWTLKDGAINPLFHEIKNKFSTAARQYFAGIWDGDGYQRIRKRKIDLSLEMAQNGCEPVFMLSKIFDLTISYVKREGKKYKNYQPTYIIHLGGPKAEMFMLLVYPYLIENRSLIREILLQRDCPESFLEGELQFSWAYLAGYADAEGHYKMKLQHEKQKRKKGYGISSCYKFCFVLTSNDFTSLTFIKNKITEKGFKFNKDRIKTRGNQKAREGRNPEKWNPTLDVSMGGGAQQLSRFYKNFYRYALIKKKRKAMEKTIEYNKIIHEQ